MILAISIVLFALGVYGVVTRPDIIRIFFGITIMLSSVTLLLVYLAGNAASMAYSIVIIAWIVEVVEVIVTLGIFLYLIRNKQTLEVLQRFKW